MKCYAGDGKNGIEMQEPKLGDRVRASMDGENWFAGKYVQESEIFAQYGVLRDDIGEVRFFSIAVVHGPVVVPSDADPDEMNRLHGEGFGVDWIYAA